MPSRSHSLSMPNQPCIASPAKLGLLCWDSSDDQGRPTFVFAPVEQTSAVLSELFLPDLRKKNKKIGHFAYLGSQNDTSLTDI